ncbi:MAG TPA: hypothetical protein VIE15_02925, partial [Acidimicrobiales bacterium]
MGTPAVLFVDDLRWDAFCQLSPRLRRAGIRTIRATSESHSRSSLVNGLLFDRWIVLDEEGTALRELAAEERIIDVQFVETLGGLVRDVLDLLDDDVADQVGRRLAVTDKLAASR